MNLGDRARKWHPLRLCWFGAERKGRRASLLFPFPRRASWYFIKKRKSKLLKESKREASGVESQEMRRLGAELELDKIKHIE